jgi:hypothetical protein
MTFIFLLEFIQNEHMSHVIINNDPKRMQRRKRKSGCHFKKYVFLTFFIEMISLLIYTVQNRCIPSVFSTSEAIRYRHKVPIISDQESKEPFLQTGPRNLDEDLFYTQNLQKISLALLVSLP